MCGILHVNVSSCLEDMRLKIMLTKSVLSEALRNFANFLDILPLKKRKRSSVSYFIKRARNSGTNHLTQAQSIRLPY